MKIRKDLLLHGLGGAASVVILFALSQVQRHFGDAAAAVLCAFVLGIGVEVYQWVRKEGTPDALDAVATGIGGTVLVILVALIRGDIPL